MRENKKDRKKEKKLIESEIDTCVQNFSKIEMVPQNLNIMDLVFNNIRVYKVQKTGEFRDKVDKEVSLTCEYDPQGINIKILIGKCDETKKKKKIFIFSDSCICFIVQIASLLTETYKCDVCCVLY